MSVYTNFGAAVLLDGARLGSAGSPRLPILSSRGPIGLCGLRLAMRLAAQLVRLSSIEFVNSPTCHGRIKHFEGAAAGIDLVVMGEIGEALEDAEQVLVPVTSQDL
jgi:hypothetical protein